MIIDTMSNNYKQCPRGHYYKGDTCPYCPTRYYPISRHTRPTRTDNLNPHKPTFYPTDTPTSTVAGTDIPLCPHCGRPVRKHVPMPPKEVCISSINNMGDGIVPWNYEWNGKCENCGRDFNIVMRIDMGSTGPDNRLRMTKVQVAQHWFPHNYNEDEPSQYNTILAGVEIEEGDKSIFLSAKELQYLIKTLQNSPILQQLDSYGVYTYEY